MKHEITLIYSTGIKKKVQVFRFIVLDDHPSVKKGAMVRTAYIAHLREDVQWNGSVSTL